jgi:hypothetical protein
VPINPAPLLLAASSLGKLQVVPRIRVRHLETCPARPAPPRGTYETPRRARLAC